MNLNLKIQLFILTAIMGISNSNFNTRDQDAVLGTSIDIELKDNKGSNLLGTEKFPIDQIIAKYQQNDSQLEKNNNSAILLDNPGNILFIDQDRSQYVRVFLNHSESDQFPLTYIHWNKIDIDTIKAKYKRTKNSVTIDKLWIFKNNSWEEIKSKPLMIIK